MVVIMRLKKYITESKVGVTTKKDRTGHIHAAIVNVDGDGKTVDTKGKGKDHEHQVHQWLVQPAHGHIHNLEDI